MKKQWRILIFRKLYNAPSTYRISGAEQEWPLSLVERPQIAVLSDSQFWEQPRWFSTALILECNQMDGETSAL